MITIFNGRSRSFGSGEQNEVFIQVSIALRQHLKLLKGAKLSVLMAISLHANSEGWAWPSLETLSDETGYNKQTISDALTDLCKTVIEGHRILLVFQPHTKQGQPGHKKGTFGSNRYLIFPSAKELETYESHTTARKARASRTHSPNVENIHTDETALECEKEPSVGFPYTEKPYTEKLTLTITNDLTINKDIAERASSAPATTFHKRKTPDVTPEHRAYLDRKKAIEDAYVAELGYTPAAFGKEAKSSKWLAEQQYTPEQVVKCYRHLQSDDFYAKQHISLATISKQIGAWVKLKHKSNGRANGATPFKPTAPPDVQPSAEAAANMLKMRNR